MMDNAKGLLDFFSDPDKCPAMAMLAPKMNLVGSIPEGTRAGDIQEIDVMMELGGFQPCYLEPSESASTLKLSTIGKLYIGKILFSYFLFKKKATSPLAKKSQG